MTDFRAPTERGRYWLDQEAKLLASRLTAKACAVDHDLSVHALYRSRKRLCTLGLRSNGLVRCGRPTGLVRSGQSRCLRS